MSYEAPTKAVAPSGHVVGIDMLPSMRLTEHDNPGHGLA